MLLNTASLNNDFYSLFKQAIECFENGESEHCQQILLDLSERRISRYQKKKVAGLMANNSFIFDSREQFIETLNSDYIKQNLDRTDLKNYNVLSHVPSLQTSWNKDNETIPTIEIGPINNPLFGINVSVNGKECIGVLDNCCADYCYATKAFAERHGITPLDYKLKVNGKENGYIGVADSLALGKLVLTNVLFVISDVNKSLITNYNFDIIIGSNVLRAVGDILINNIDNTITFSRNYTCHSKNIKIFSESHTYYTEALFNEEKVSLLLDFGCSRTHMNSKYYNLRKEELNKICIESEITFANVSHSETSKSYVINSGQFIVCDAQCEMKDVHIQRSPHSSNGVDGSIGVDMLRKFNYIEFNAQKLYMLLYNEHTTDN